MNMPVNIHMVFRIVLSINTTAYKFIYLFYNYSSTKLILQTQDQSPRWYLHKS